MEQVTIPAAALDWIFNGEPGASSKAMCAKFLGMQVRTPWRWHPADVGDFGRCLKLLDAVPEWKARVPEMAKVTPAWAAVAAIWDELTVLYHEAEFARFSLRIEKAIHEAPR